MVEDEEIFPADLETKRAERERKAADEDFARSHKLIELLKEAQEPKAIIEAEWATPKGRLFLISIPHSHPACAPNYEDVKKIDPLCEGTVKAKVLQYQTGIVVGFCQEGHSVRLDAAAAQDDISSSRIKAISEEIVKNQSSSCV